MATPTGYIQVEKASTVAEPPKTDSITNQVKADGKMTVPAA